LRLPSGVRQGVNLCRRWQGISRLTLSRYPKWRYEESDGEQFIDYVSESSIGTILLNVAVVGCTCWLLSALIARLLLYTRLLVL